MNSITLEKIEITRIDTYFEQQNINNRVNNSRWIKVSVVDKKIKRGEQVIINDGLLVKFFLRNLDFEIILSNEISDIFISQSTFFKFYDFKWKHMNNRVESWFIDLLINNPNKCVPFFQYNNYDWQPGVTGKVKKGDYIENGFRKELSEEFRIYFSDNINYEYQIINANDKNYKKRLNYTSINGLANHNYNFNVNEPINKGKDNYYQNLLIIPLLSELETIEYSQNVRTDWINSNDGITQVLFIKTLDLLTIYQKWKYLMRRHKFNNNYDVFSFNGRIEKSNKKQKLKTYYLL